MRERIIRGSFQPREGLVVMCGQCSPGVQVHKQIEIQGKSYKGVQDCCLFDFFMLVVKYVQCHA